MQNAAIAAKRDALPAAGWTDVVVLDPGKLFHGWDHERVPKKKGGRVYIAVSQRGEVEVHEGYLSRKEAQRRARRAELADAEDDDSTAKPVRSEVTKAMQNYLDLHRHATVRLALLRHPGVALRLLVAHALASSGHWQVTVEPQAARSDAIAQSIANSAAQQAFEAERRAVLALLDRPEDHETAVRPAHDAYPTVAAFARLLTLSDDEVLRVAAVAMAETLAAGSAAVEAAGVHLRADARECWQPDEAFFDLIRDRAAINAMLAEVAGKTVADANLAEKVASQKGILRDCLAGTNGREKVEGWLPGWLTFPVRACTAHGSFATVDEWARVRDLLPDA